MAAVADGAVTAGETRVGTRRRRRLALAAIVLAGLSYATVIQSFSWNQSSHYDLIRSIYSGGTTIDAYQQNTGDKVLYHHHYYSSRSSRSRSTQRCAPSTRTRSRASSQRSAVTTR